VTVISTSWVCTTVWGVGVPLVPQALNRMLASTRAITETNKGLRIFFFSPGWFLTVKFYQPVFNARRTPV
jgi:hypothetical protein